MKYKINLKYIKVKISLGIFILFNICINTNTALAQSTDGSNNYCQDSLFPTLVICGRSASSACQEYVKPCSLADIPLVFGNIIQFAITFILILFPLYVMYIGIQMIISRGEPKSLAENRKKIIASLGYFILIFAAWLIVKTVVEAFGVSKDIPSFLLDRNGSRIENPGKPIK